MARKRFSETEAHRIVEQYEIIATVTFFVLMGGTVFYHMVEGWRWLDAFYFSVVSLATVGYGDFTPQTDIGKLFTVFYLIIGISLFAALLNTILRSRMAKRSLRERERDNDAK